MAQKKKKKPAPRSGIFVAMILRHPRGGKMKDRRAERDGAKNKQREYISEE